MATARKPATGKAAPKAPPPKPAAQAKAAARPAPPPPARKAPAKPAPAAKAAKPAPKPPAAPAQTKAVPAPVTSKKSEAPKPAARKAEAPKAPPARKAEGKAEAPKPAAPPPVAEAPPAPPPPRPAFIVAPPTVPARPGLGRPGAPPSFAVRGPGRPGVAEGQAAAPRPPAQKVELRAGDHVVYPTHGVGQVQGIETIEAAGLPLDMVVVTFEENRMTLRVPVNKVATAGLRKLFTPKEFEAAIDTLKGKARIKRTMWSRRAQEYEAKINSGDPIQIAEVVRDLQRNAGQPDQSFSERQIYEQALDRLAAEYAAIEKIDRAAAAEKLVGFAKSA